MTLVVLFIVVVSLLFGGLYIIYRVMELLATVGADLLSGSENEAAQRERTEATNLEKPTHERRQP